MRLDSFSVLNYRSITKAHKLPMADLTVLVGQNNEGKSNLLAALNAAMTVTSSLAERPIIRGRIVVPYRSRNFYQWDRDYPIPLQEKNPNGESVFRLEFSLTEQEQLQFEEEVVASPRSSGHFR